MDVRSFSFGFSHSRVKGQIMGGSIIKQYIITKGLLCAIMNKMELCHFKILFKSALDFFV